MNRAVIVWLTCCFAMFGIAASLWAAEDERQKTPEQQAWEEVDSFNEQSVEEFLQGFPSGELAKQANMALELQRKMMEIRSGKSKSEFVIPFSVLGEQWENWQKRNPDKGVVGYFAKKGEKYNSLGWFLPDPLSGGKTGGSKTISFDSRGLLTSPTGDGSIVAFRTGGLQFELFKGLIFKTPGDEPMYFGVVGGNGLVHLSGAGMVTLPDGKTGDLK